MCLLVAAARGQMPIRLKSGAFDPLAGRSLPALPRSLAARPSHFLLQFQSVPGLDTVKELERRGVRVLASVPDNGLLVSIVNMWDLEGLDLRWAGWLGAGDKLSPAAQEAGWSGWLVVFHPDVDSQDARRLLSVLGLEPRDHPDLLPNQFLVLGPVEMVELAAGYDEVAYILPASIELVSGQRVTGCNGAMLETGAVGEYVKTGRGWAAVGGQVDLRYVFQTITARLDAATVKSEVVRALSEWARYAPVNFSPGDNSAANRTIAILFARGAHGDAYPFDGPGKALAHTFYPAPPNTEPAAGDMHLDDDEAWGPGEAIDLYSVALHEAGHALGLGHSDRPGAVMYPYYRSNTGLNQDDIAGIRDLYGSRETTTATPPVAPPATPPPATPPPTVPPPVRPPSGPPDSTPPSLQIKSPPLSIVSTSAASITVRGIAGDNVGVTAVKWTVSTGATGVAAGTASWTADVPLFVGNNVVTVRAYDAAGNSGWRTLTVVRR